MIRIAICDDEPLMAEEISGRLSAYMEEKQIASYRADRFLSSRLFLAADCDFDLIFLDIQMEQPNGMETAKNAAAAGTARFADICDGFKRICV